jgi:dTDP-4-dehydrorhamnose 3,5-epimerase
MDVHRTDLQGVLVIEPRVFEDDRGWFMESWNRRLYEEMGVKASFVQDNLSHSRKGVLRGLHFQNPNAQGKLVSVLQGEVFDVVVDLRRTSPTFGKSLGMELSSRNRRQVYIPEGFAHGFLVLSDMATFFYKCTAFYDPQSEHTLLWNDPALGIDWKIKHPVVSAKDQQGRLLKELDDSWLFP